MPIQGAIKDHFNTNEWQRPVQVDPSTHALMTIGHSHVEIHEGGSFTAHITNTTANSDDDRTLIGFYTPDTTKWLHIVFNVAVSAQAEIFLIEGPTIDLDEGTQIFAYNRNRNSSNTSGILSLETTPQAGKLTWMLEAEVAAANLTGGWQLEHRHLGAGKAAAIGGDSRGTEEWMLKQNTLYVFYVQNEGANANRHHINLDWYEHTDKN
jgi:hypothetical protein